MDKKPEEKEYSLKPIEVNSIANMQQRAQQQLFDFCTFIAMERLAYPATQNTSYRVDGDKLYIAELQPEPEEEVVSIVPEPKKGKK